LSAALCNTVRPSKSVSAMSAPDSSSSRMTAWCPFSVAWCSADHPLSSAPNQSLSRYRPRSPVVVAPLLHAHEMPIQRGLQAGLSSGGLASPADEARLSVCHTLLRHRMRRHLWPRLQVIYSNVLKRLRG
jgi:hypothetical protein